MARVSRQQRTRDDLVAELRGIIENCSVSRERRRGDADTFKQWYDLGTEHGTPAANNKLRSHLDRLASFCWAPDTVRFGVHLPPSSRDLWIKAAQTARDEFRQTWAVSGADRTISLAFEWALVYGAIPLKLRLDPLGFAVDSIDPWDFGVSREDQELEDQDAITHWYAFSWPQYQRWVLGHPREAELLQLGETHKQTGAVRSGRPLIVTGISGAFPASTVSTVIPGDMPDAVYGQGADVREPIIQLVDVWQRTIYTDARTGTDYEDWRVTTLFADTADFLMTRRNPILGWQAAPNGPLPGELPFSLLVPRPVPNYLWGRSQLLDLMPLQKWREDQIVKMREVIARQLQPAKLLTGIPNGDEAIRALETPGGSYASPSPEGKMTVVEVKVGQEAFGMLASIDHMFDDQSGIPPLIAMGEQPGGVRANSQLLSLAGIGAGRIRHTATQLESTISRVATQAFRLLQRHDDQTYTASDGTRFILAQLPPETMLQVSAHSAAPIFAEQTEQKAAELLKAGAIDGEWFSELINPPYREEIKQVARELAKQKAQMQERMIELELTKLKRRGARP